MSDVQPERATGRVLLLRSAMKFGVVGVVNTGVYYGTYLALRLALPYFAAHLLALAVAMVASFFLNCYWTFRTRPTWRKFALFPLTNAVNYLMITVGVVVLVEWVGLDSRIAPLLAAVAAIPVTFVLSRRVLTGRARAGAGDTGSVPAGAAPLPGAAGEPPQS
jgi:putative flippase GtrA